MKPNQIIALGKPHVYYPPGYFSLLTTILTTNDSVYCVSSVWKLPASCKTLVLFLNLIQIDYVGQNIKLCICTEDKLLVSGR